MRLHIAIDINSPIIPHINKLGSRGENLALSSRSSVDPPSPCRKRVMDQDGSTRSRAGTLRLLLASPVVIQLYRDFLRAGP